MENRVTVSICGEEYTFVAEEAPSYMQKVGAYVGTKMDEMLTGAKATSRSGPNSSPTPKSTIWLSRPDTSPSNRSCVS